MINLLLLNNFYSVKSYRRVEKENDELSYTVWSLVMVRAPELPARKGLNKIPLERGGRSFLLRKEKGNDENFRKKRNLREREREREIELKI